MTNFEIYTQWTTIQDIVGPAVKWLHLWYAGTSGQKD